MKNVFYFGYGQKNFGYDENLGKKLQISFRENEGAGIAIIRGKHIDSFPYKLNLVITNNCDIQTTIRVEKKFSYNVKTSFYNLEPNSNTEIFVSFTAQELKNIKELVVAILEVDNINTENASISLNLN